MERSIRLRLDLVNLYPRCKLGQSKLALMAIHLEYTLLFVSYIFYIL